MMYPVKQAKKIKLKTLLFAFAAIVLFFMNSFSATVCTPESAYMCAAVDDQAWVYINGIYVDYFPYVNWDQAGVYPRCVTFTAAQLASLAPTGNVLAVKDLNTNCCEIWASWSLNITCQSGQHSYVSSDDGTPISMWYDERGCTVPTPTPGGSPLPDPTHTSSSRTWYDPLYVEGTSGLSWVAPTIVTGQKWGKRIWDPASGDLLPALGYSATSPAGVNDCKQLFYRQGFDLPVEPTPAPPNFTITKSANPNSNIGFAPPDTITFTLRICNTGGGTQGNPVVIDDIWTGAADNWDYFWPYTYTDTLFGQIVKTGSGKSATITFESGFLSNRCFDYSFAVKLNSGVPTFCDSWINTANLMYLAQPTKVATAPVTHYCPPPANFTLTKSASTTTLSGPNQQFTFTLRLCNTGGAAWTGTMYLNDDMTSAPGDSGYWQYEGPYFTDNPAVGIDYISTSGSTNEDRRYEIKFQQPGFTGCVDIPFYNKTTGNYACGPWYNRVSMEPYLTYPTRVSTVDMYNYCSPTFTPTHTRTITQTRTPTPTYTRTPTPTFTRTPTPTRTVTQTNSPSGMSPTFTPTRTPTPTFTRTITPTFTITPQPTMDITKTANVGVAVFGDTITYTLSYRNTGGVTANPVCIYDTVPSALTYIGSSLAPTTGAPFLSWCIGAVPAGVSGTITWWGRITSYPFLPIFDWRRDVFAFEKNKNAVFACRYREYSLYSGSLYTLKE